MHPFESGVLAAERSIDVATAYTEGWRTVGLHFRADGFRSDGKQPGTRQVEQHARVFIGIDEAVFIHVEDDDGLGCILDKGAITLLIFPQCDFRFLAFRYIAQADDENAAAHRFERAYVDLGNEGLAIGAAGFHVATLELEARIVGAGQVRRQELGKTLLFRTWQQVLDLRTDDLVLGQSEVAGTDLVADADRAGVADRQQRFGNAVENALDRRGRGERLRDRRLHAVIMLVDQAQQFDEVRFLDTGRLRCLLDPVPEVPIHAPRCSSSVTRGGR